MFRVEIDETIERPVDEVFGQLVDIGRYPEWMPQDGLFVTCRVESDGPVGRGTTYLDKTRLGTFHGEVSAFEPPREVVFHYAARLLGVKVMEGWPGYVLRPEGADATRVHHVAVGQTSGAFKLLEPLIERLARRERKRTVVALRQSLEG